MSELMVALAALAAVGVVGYVAGRRRRAGRDLIPRTLDFTALAGRSEE